MNDPDRELTHLEKANIKQIKDLGGLFWRHLESIGQGRELSLAKTKIEEAVMWATKAISG